MCKTRTRPREDHTIDPTLQIAVHEARQPVAQSERCAQQRRFAANIFDQVIGRQESRVRLRAADMHPQRSVTKLLLQSLRHRILGGRQLGSGVLIKETLCPRRQQSLFRHRRTPPSLTSAGATRVAQT